jgi:hypothetical protein
VFACKEVNIQLWTFSRVIPCFDRYISILSTESSNEPFELIRVAQENRKAPLATSGYPIYLRTAFLSAICPQKIFVIARKVLEINIVK